jgi:hypothetical protein
MEKQEAIMQKPGQTLVTPQQEYALLNDFAKLGGFPSASPYFMDPQSPMGQQNAQTIAQNMQQEKQKEEQKDVTLLQAQVKVANAEAQKADTNAQNVMLKAQNDQVKNQLQHQQQQADAEIDWLKQQLEEARTLADKLSEDDELQFKYWDRNKFYETEEMRIEATAKAAKENNENSE